MGFFMERNRAPTVFVSSTCNDLKQVREDIRDFCHNTYGLEVLLSEFESFPIDPCRGTFENCLKNVDEYADIFVLIVGTRYGCMTEQGKSITNLEYLHAKAKGIPIYVFVSRQLYNNLPLWRNNKDCDFSSVVDNPKLFEFVAEIYDEAHQWIYTYDSVHDITTTLKNQFLLNFADGLKYKKIKSQPQYSLLESNIPTEAKRVLIEKPYAWEYKFLAYVLKDDFSKLKERKWDYKYGLFEGLFSDLGQISFLDKISEKINEMLKLAECLGILINYVMNDAIGESGVPSDLEMMLYASKQVASIYDRIIGWALYFKSLHADIQYSRLIELLYKFPASVLQSIDDFVSDYYDQTTCLPDEYDGKKREIKTLCSLSTTGITEINNEIHRLITLQKSKQ